MIIIQELVNLFMEKDSRAYYNTCTNKYIKNLIKIGYKLKEFKPEDRK